MNIHISLHRSYLELNSHGYIDNIARYYLLIIITKIAK